MSGGSKSTRRGRAQMRRHACTTVSAMSWPSRSQEISSAVSVNQGMSSYLLFRQTIDWQRERLAGPLARKLDQRAHELAACPGVAPRLRLIAERRAGDIQMCPGSL